MVSDLERMKKERDKWYQLAIKYTKYYAGKFATVPRVPVTKLTDFAIWYTPGVAAVSREIHKNRELSFELTSRWNTIAIISDGTRVLGLGNVGPEAAMPVMEGKALLFKYLGGVDAVPIVIGTTDRDEIVDLVKKLEPTFGGVNLEDIESPKCFYLLDTLRKELKIPVWHDDQQGTAGATLAGLYNALKLTGRKLTDSKIVLVGAGASNVCTFRVLVAAGVPPGNMIVLDSKGILHPEREDMDRLMIRNPWKYEIAMKSNKEGVKGGIPEALEGADVVIAASRPGPGIIKKEWIAKMNKDPIVFALANPVPEIWPWEAKEAGAKITATGRSDLPNQINNSLMFPAVFRGALDAKAITITDEMMIAAARELAKFAEEKGIHENYIIPTMMEWEVYPRVAAAVATKAIEQGIARVKESWQYFHDRAIEIIGATRKTLELLMKHGIIPPFPD